MKRRRNSYEATTWQEALLVANDILERKGPGTLEQARATILQLSPAELSNMLQEFVLEALPVNESHRRESWLKRDAIHGLGWVADTDVHHYMPSLVGKVWNVVYVDDEQGSMPDDKMVDQLRGRIGSDEALLLMFENVQWSHAYGVSWFSFTPARWMEPIGKASHYQAVGGRQLERTSCDECESTLGVRHVESENHNAHLCAACREKYGYADPGSARWRPRFKPVAHLVKNPYDHTTWAEAELVANDALEEKNLEAAQQAIGQVSDDELADMLVALVNEVTPAQYPARRPGDEAFLFESQSRLEQARKAWNRVHIAGPTSSYGNFPKLATIMVQELRQKMNVLGDKGSPVLRHMFDDVSRAHAHWDGEGFDIVFTPKRWLRNQRNMGVWLGSDEGGVPFIHQNPAGDGGATEGSDERPRLLRVPRIHGVIDRERSPRAGRAVSDPHDAVDAMVEYIGDRATEQFIVMYIDVRNRIVGFAEYTEGGLAGVGISQGDVIRNALLTGAPAFITAHNHPSGDVTPSAEDFALWEQLDENAKRMNMVALDHFVIGSERYYAAREARSYPLTRRRR